MTTTRVDRKTASGIEWVTKIDRGPGPRQIRISSRFIRSRVISSSAPNGSSISSIAGSKAKRPGDRHALLHPARELPRVCVRELAQLHELEQRPRHAASRWSLGTPVISSGSSTFRWTVRHSISTGAWKAIP